MADPKCAVCGLKGDLKQCAACKQVHYCSVDHQKSDWKKHKSFCKTAQNAPAAIAAAGAGLNKKAAETGQMRARLRQMMLSDPAFYGHGHDHDHSQCDHDHDDEHGHSHGHAPAEPHVHGEHCNHAEEEEQDHVHGPGCDHDSPDAVHEGHVHGPNCNHEHHEPPRHFRMPYPYLIPPYRRTAQPLLRIGDFQIDGIKAQAPAKAQESVQFDHFNPKSKNMPLFVLMHSVNRGRGGTFESDVFFVPMVTEGRFLTPVAAPDPQMATQAKEREAKLLEQMQRLAPEEMLVTFTYSKRHNVLGKAPTVRLHVPGSRRWLNLHVVTMSVCWQGKVSHFEFATIHFYVSGYFQMLFDFVFAHLGITEGIETGAVDPTTLPLKSVQVWAYHNHIQALALEALSGQFSPDDPRGTSALNDIVTRLAQSYGLAKFNFEYLPEGYDFPAAITEKPAQNLRLFVYPPESGAFSGDR
eukprot:TRINITY_DN1716_c0_g3_i1.p1 TRINITY_DN1716_c0_g3~~TRINITY_DN1716_c0_g3_i1.p1  ORF type:complete len:467 (+),score=115.62 TRINITY_DN1716_c0_g3_i1:67-1467(+)